MRKSRLEAFSDGVLAIIITIMVLEMKVPHGNQLSDLKLIAPVFLSYILSFINIGIYWNNHHHMLSAVQKVDGKVLWANSHLLFWLSLVPFASGWMGENHFTKWPVIIYGIILFMSGVAYTILCVAFIHLHGKDSTLAIALGKDRKGRLSIYIYAASILLCFINPYLGLAGYAMVALMWFIPDRRIEKKLSDEAPPENKK